MSLDMYLHVKRRFAPESADARAIEAEMGKEFNDEYLPFWDHVREGDPTEFTKAKDILEAAGLLVFRPTSGHGGHLTREDGKVVVSLTSIYWRKANAIHGWFVDNVQGGVDDCRDAPVSREQLAALRATCVKALVSLNTVDHPGDVLPPRSGFFFGSTSYDEGYRDDLTHTINEIDRVLAIDALDAEFFYRSSW